MEIRKIEIVSTCGQWKQNDLCEWEFILDYERGGSCCDVEENISFDQLIKIIHEDFGIDRLKSVIKVSYCLPSAAICLKQGSTPPMYIRNDRKLCAFINKLKAGSEKMLLCVQVIETESGENSVSDIHPDKQDNAEISCISFSAQQTEASSTAEKESEAVPLTLSPFESPVAGKAYAYKSNPQAFDIYVSRRFSSKEELVLKMKQWAIEWNFEYKTVKSDSDRVQLRCVDCTCSWKMRAARMKSGYFEIKKYVHRHTCDTTFRNPNHRQASVKTLATMICGNYSEKKDGLKPKQIIHEIKQHYGVHINYKKAWRAKGAAENLLRGTHEESYINLAKWLYVAKERNPGTVTYLQSSEGKFKYSFIAFRASIRGFRLMRRVIAVDVTFLKGKFKGTLLCATAQDGDYHLYPLAFTIVDSENNESWNWFMRCLESIISDASDLVFISDRAPSIAKALTDVYPSSHHGICRFHLETNIKARFHTADMIDLVQAASNAYTVVEFTEVFQTISELNQKLAAYLNKADFSKWARSYAPQNRYNIMTTNIAESLNAMLRDSRDLPVKALYESIRMTLTDWFLKRCIKAADHSKTVTPTVVKNLVKNYDTPTVVKNLVKNYDDALKFDVYQVNEDELQVKKNKDTFIVDLAKKQCSCRVFDIERIPCIHAIAAAKSVNLDVNDYVYDFYSTKTWAAAYASLIFGPPSTKINRGRPAKKRKRSNGEYGVIGSESKGYKGGRCSQVGHNKQTCDVAI